MESTAFDDYILSDREIGVRSHHDALRKAVPVIDQADEPAPNTLREINAKLLGLRSEAAE